MYSADISRTGKINASQMSGIRRILIIPPTHIDREWTNERAMTKAELERGKYYNILGLVGNEKI